MHPEDLKAALRKQFGTMTAFERAHNLPHESVSDFLRRKRSRRVEAAIEKVLMSNARSKVGAKSGEPDNNPVRPVSHSLNAKAA